MKIYLNFTSGENISSSVLSLALKHAHSLIIVFEFCLIESNLAHWGKWSTWGSCFSPTNCGQGRKLRVRVCEISYYSNTGDLTCSKGSAMDSTSCILPPCKLSMSVNIFLTNLIWRASMKAVHVYCNWYNVFPIEIVTKTTTGLCL